MNTTNAIPASEAAGATLTNRRILVPLDLTHDSGRAIRYAVRLAQAEQGSLCLLHVVDFGPFKGDVADSPMFHSSAHILGRAERHLRLLAQRDVPPGVTCRTRVVTGKVGREIVKAAEDVCADLIVLTPVQHSWVERLFARDLTRWLQTHAPCSVVVLRKPRYACDCGLRFGSPATAPAALTA